MAQILGDGPRWRSALFSSLQSRSLFEDRFGRPAKGNDKGKAEGMVGHARRSVMVPIPDVRDIDELNALLLERCIARRKAVLRGADGTIAERLAADRAAFPERPAVSFDACDTRPGVPGLTRRHRGHGPLHPEPGAGALQEFERPEIDPVARFQRRTTHRSRSPMRTAR